MDYCRYYRYVLLIYRRLRRRRRRVIFNADRPSTNTAGDVLIAQSRRAARALGPIVCSLRGNPTPDPFPPR